MSIDSDDVNDLAGEYVLGTLTGAERVAFEARLQRDEAAKRAVALWALHLQPLADSVTPAIPRPELWQRIQRDVGAPTKSRAPLWIAAAVAAVIVAVSLLFPNLIQGPDVTAVAQIGPQGAPAAFVVEVLDDREALLVRAAAVEPRADRSYELWAVPPSGVPVSLGVIEASGETRRDVAGDLRALISTGATLAISLEPVGGSTTGAPTEVLYAGTLQAPAGE
jgi:anti-sigma-K factor RskA